MRGIVNKDLTPQFALELSQSIGTFFQRSTLLVGCDGRVSSPLLLNLVLSGLTSCGCNVRTIGQAPTPAIQFLCKAWDLGGAVAVTASHNPPEYNGIKVVGPDGIEITREQEEQVEGIFHSRSWVRADWGDVGKVVTITSPFEDYRASIRSHVDVARIKERSLKVVVDAGNGVGALVTPLLLAELGCRVFSLNANIDGTFPGRSPEPTPQNLEQLAQAVKVFGADFGVAHDGDADRSIFVDEAGVAHWGDRTFALIEDQFLSENPGETIVTPVSSSQIISEVAQAHGARVEWTKVGSVHVSHVMSRIGAKLGGEENGGIFFAPHIPVRDGAMATALVAEIVAKTGKRLSELLRKLPRYHIVKDKVQCPDAFKSTILEGVRDLAKGERTDTIDGVKIWFRDRSWILIRPSGTEPIFRLFAEATTQPKAERLLKAYAAKVRELLKERTRHA